MNLFSKMNLFLKQKHSENKFTVTKGEREGGINEEFGINTLIYIKIENQKGPTVKHREL